MFSEKTKEGIHWFREKYPEGGLCCKTTETFVECAVQVGSARLAQAVARIEDGRFEDAGDTSVYNALILAGYVCGGNTASKASARKEPSRGKDAKVREPECENTAEPAHDKSPETLEVAEGEMQPLPSTTPEAAAPKTAVDCGDDKLEVSPSSEGTADNVLAAAKRVMFAVNSSVPGPYVAMAGKTMGEVFELRPGIIRLIVQKAKSKNYQSPYPKEVLDAAITIAAACKE